MPDDALRTLFYPFETGMLATPAPGAPVLVFGAAAGFRRPDGFDAELHAVQGFRPDFLALGRQGIAVSPVARGKDYAAALVLLSRYRGANEARIAEGLQRVRPGGLIVIAGSRRDGAGSLRKRLASRLPLVGSAAKSHGIAFWLERQTDADAERAAAALRAFSTAAESAGIPLARDF